MKPLLLAALPLLLGSCALLGTLPGLGTAPSPATAPAREASAPLTAQAEAAATAEGVTVTLTLRGGDARPLRLRYAAQVNWGSCGLPPYVNLTRAGGAPVSAPPSAARLTCPELGFTRTLAPGETLTLRRTLPPLPPGTYTLTAWLDGEVEGAPTRVQALPVLLEVR